MNRTESQIINATGTTLIFKNGYTLPPTDGAIFELTPIQGDTLAIKIGSDYLPATPIQSYQRVYFPKFYDSVYSDAFVIVPLQLGLAISAMRVETRFKILSPEGMFNEEGNFVVSDLRYWKDCNVAQTRRTYSEEH